jgi:hypothetical protein
VTAGPRAKLLAVIAALITYGSLYPFQFAVPEAHAEAWARLLGGALRTSKGDLLGNLALFFPFGFAGVFALERDRHPPLSLAMVICTSAVLATLLQVAQIYVPTRNAALIDVALNIAGTGLGIAAGLFLSGRVRLPGMAWHDVRALPLALVALWAASELLPLVPSLDLQALKDSAKALLRPSLAIDEVAVHAAGAAVAGWALSALLGETLALRALVALAAAVAAGKLIIVTQVLDASVVTGLALGCAGWAAISRLRAPQRAEALLALLGVACLLRALSPFEFRSEPGALSMVPFAALLSGSMLVNSKALAASSFLYTAILGLMRALRAAPVPATLALAVVVTLLELLQLFIVRRSADITEPLLVLAIGWLVYLSPTPGARPAAQAARPAARREPGSARREPPRVQPRQPARAGIDLRRWALALGGTCAVLAISMALVLRLPRVPYNVRELFLGGGALPFLVIFSIALLWTGAGPRLIGHRLAASRRPWLALPLLAFGAGVASLLLLMASVTAESILDIAGSTNLYWFVTNRDIWGAPARSLFTFIGSPGLVAFFERPVRYAALYGPLVTFPALMFYALETLPRGTVRPAHLAAVALSSVLWLWLCKAIAFDWASTDNLNELIARDGPWGWGGGGYLYLLLALISGNAVLLAVVPARGARMVAAAVITIVLLPLGWWLLNQGLEQQIHKYSLVFSGAQFLLGPDRKQGLDTEVLFARWCVVQFGAVLIMAAGARFARPIAERMAARE